MKSIITKILLLVPAALALPTAAEADTIVITDSSFWNSSNHERVFIGGGGNDYWISYDDGTTTGVDRQQWVWMDIGTAWTSLIPAGHEVVDATLTFAGANVESGKSNADFSVFEVDGSDMGRQAIIDFNGDGRDGHEVPDYYAGKTHYGLVTEADITAAGAVTFDVTDLIKGWHAGTLTMNVGEMILLGDDNVHWVNWGERAATPIPIVLGPHSPSRRRRSLPPRAARYS